MVDTIYISWRKQIGDNRYIIARLKRNVTDGITFKYLEGYEKAKKDGLEHFLGFKNSQSLNQESLELLLSLRVISKERPDRNSFLSFWEAENEGDIFDLLALTQGRSQTDNFEFLALYNPQKNLKFVTDIAKLSHLKLPPDTVKKGDLLSYRLEKGNKFDKYAVAVYKNDKLIGYVKRKHNIVFHRSKRDLRLTVKAVDENGSTKQIFVKVDYP